MTTSQPPRLSFLLRALGFYIGPPQIPQPQQDANTPVQPLCPMWDTAHLSSRCYFIQMLNEEHQPQIPATEEGRAALEAKLVELPELGDEEVERFYREIMGMEDVWEGIDELVRNGYRAGEMEGEEWMEWVELRVLRGKEVGNLERGVEGEDVVKRAVLNDALLWIVAVDHRWNFPGADGVVKALVVSELTLMFEWYMLRVFLDKGPKYVEVEG